ncbi:hypothetical protein D3C80_1271340 [compost metagenome]
MAAPSLQVDHPVDRAEVQQCWDERGFRHLGVGHVDRLGHDERHGAHHRRHQLAAHAGGRLDATGKCRFVAKTLHQRNGELSGGDDIGHPRAGNGTHQCRGEHRHFGRPSAAMAEQPHGEIGEQTNHARLLKKCAEQDEQVNVGG